MDSIVSCRLHRSLSPTSTSEKSNANLINLKCLYGKKYSHQCFIGNFNFTNINWFTWIKQPNEEKKRAQFIETIRNCYICLHLLEPTRSRSRSTNNSSLIDLVLINEVMLVSDIEYHAPLSKSGHCVITFKYHCRLDCSQPKGRFVYHETDFDWMRRKLVLCNWREKFMMQNQSKSVDQL